MVRHGIKEPHKAEGKEMDQENVVRVNPAPRVYTYGTLMREWADHAMQSLEDDGVEFSFRKRWIGHGMWSWTWSRARYIETVGGRTLYLRCNVCTIKNK